MAKSLFWACLAYLGHVAYSQEHWMEWNWAQIRSKSLTQLVLPGSHNSGNLQTLGSGPTCTSDYRYGEYRSEIGEDARLTPKEFDREFIPWNINHNQTVRQQLEAGVRFFHLKLCNFNSGILSGFDLAKVRHQHRGYTVAETFNEFLDEVVRFLLGHPREVVLLGFMNLHNETGIWDDATTAALASTTAAHLRTYFNLVRGVDLSKTMEQLISENKRLGLFFKPPASAPLPVDVVDASQYLREAWDASMAGGDLEASRAWLESELRWAQPEPERAKSPIFHVLQANPNDAEAKMYRRLEAGQPPHSLKEWLTPFLESLEDLVLEAARTGRVEVNAVNSDFLDLSRTYNIAMQLMGLPVAKTGLQSACLNPAVRSGRFEDRPVNKSRYKLRAAYVLQRHCDRWIYEHENIGSVCWPKQLNSSVLSSPFVASSCDNMAKTQGSNDLVTAWQRFEASTDPYARPTPGHCQVFSGTPQAIDQGRAHSYRWGEMLKEQYVPELIAEGCPTGSMAIYADKVHKNEITVQTAYQAICGKLPSANEFSPEATLVGYAKGRAKGTPWYLQSAQCTGETLTRQLNEANEAKSKESWWKTGVQKVAQQVAEATSKSAPASADAASFLDSVMDCIVVHACMGLDDTPKEFLTNGDLARNSSLFRGMDESETRSRTWALEYWKSKGEDFRSFASRYYGYFFAVLKDRLLAATKGVPEAQKLSIGVMSDSNISPILFMYGLEVEARQRPPYLSALVHEVYHDEETKKDFVRVLFNGKVLHVCKKDPAHFPLCPLDVWAQLVSVLEPSEEACPVLYEGYEFLDPASAYRSPSSSSSSSAAAAPAEAAAEGAPRATDVTKAKLSQSSLSVVGLTTARATPFLAGATSAGDLVEAPTAGSEKQPIAVIIASLALLAIAYRLCFSRTRGSALAVVVGTDEELECVRRETRRHAHKC